MRTQMMVIRSLTAAVLFVMLSKVNVWADTQTHLVLAAGYRAFLLGAPLFLCLGLNAGMRLALAVCLAGAVGTMHSVNEFNLGLLALGMAVSGYFAKLVTAHTSQGAADNKVSLNIGSLLSGLILMVITDSLVTKILAVALLSVSFVLSWRVDWQKLDQPITPKDTAVACKKREWRPCLAWGLIGVATGIKLTGIFAILPQYLMIKLGGLPTWFGSLVILNSFLVIVLQHRILHFLDRSSPSATFLMSLSAMVILALPALMRAENLVGAVIWITLLTIGECALSRYDRTAREEGYLFPKEMMVGLGSFITVTLSRSLTQDIYWSGLAGVACLIVGTLLLRPARTKHVLAPVPKAA